MQPVGEVDWPHVGAELLFRDRGGLVPVGVEHPRPGSTELVGKLPVEALLRDPAEREHVEVAAASPCLTGRAAARAHDDPLGVGAGRGDDELEGPGDGECKDDAQYEADEKPRQDFALAAPLLLLLYGR